MTDRQQVIDALTKPFPREAIQRQQNFEYVSGETVIYRLNTATNYDWQFEITDHEMVGGANAQGNKPALVVYGRMRIPIISDGWRSDMGTQALENSKDDHEIHKGAVTDCIKRCARLFGVGLHLWGPDIEAGEIGNRPAPQPARQPSRTRTVDEIAGGGTIAPGVGMTDQQRKAIFAIAKNERGMAETDIEAMSMELFGVELRALDKAQASELISRLKDPSGGGLALPHPQVQQAMDHRDADWMAKMGEANSMVELSRIGRQIAEANVTSDELRAAYRKHTDRLQEKALA